MLHALKILPEHFEDICNETKKFEVRKNDRDFHDGDVVALNEWKPESKAKGGGSYTGRYLLGTIVKVYNYPDFLQDGYVILQLKGFCGSLLSRVYGELREAANKDV